MNRRFLVDLNVVLDVLLDRQPHVRPAAALWSRIEAGQVEGLLPAHAVTTVHYLARRHRDSRFARQAVGDLLRVFDVARVDREVLLAALGAASPDFEDAVAAACALAADCDAIVTRDPAGFRKAGLPVLDPQSAIALLEADRDG